MLNTGDWVEFTKDGAILRGFVIGPTFFNQTIVETKLKLYNVPDYQLRVLKTEFHKHDKEMLIDMALASHNQGLFESLVGSVGVRF